MLDARTILAHCVWLDDSELDLLAVSGATVAHNPISNAKLASGVAPVEALRARGMFPVATRQTTRLTNGRTPQGTFIVPQQTAFRKCWWLIGVLAGARRSRDHRPGFVAHLIFQATTEACLRATPQRVRSRGSGLRRHTARCQGRRGRWS
ncbi:MAG: amidohydrolase family protein [Chloroflexi bacterium]|nr:amidohydrolase family protein [Chloroflexota bacterium]